MRTAHAAHAQLAQFANHIKIRDRVGVMGLLLSPLPHHRTCGFDFADTPHPAVEPGDLPRTTHARLPSRNRAFSFPAPPIPRVTFSPRRPD